MTEYWLISAPGDKTCQQTWDTMNNITAKQNALSANYKFHIPDLKVGTLDQLVGLSDDLGKLDTYVEQVTRKVASYLGEVLEDQRDKLHENLMANNSQTSMDGESESAGEGGPDTPPNTPVTPSFRPTSPAAATSSAATSIAAISNWISATTTTSTTGKERQRHWRDAHRSDSPEPTTCLGQHRHHHHHHHHHHESHHSQHQSENSHHHHQQHHHQQQQHHHHHHHQAQHSQSHQHHQHDDHSHRHHQHHHHHHHHQRDERRGWSSHHDSSPAYSMSCYQTHWCGASTPSTPSPRHSPSPCSPSLSCSPSSSCSSADEEQHRQRREEGCSHGESSSGSSKSRPRRRRRRQRRPPRPRTASPEDHDEPAKNNNDGGERRRRLEQDQAAGILPNPGDLPTYITRFQWDMAKYPIKQSLRNIADIISKQVGQIDADLKTKSTTYNNLKGSLQNLEKKQTGSLLTRNLADLVKKEHFILDSEYLTTLLVIVPKASFQEWNTIYEKLTDMIVPRSSQMINQDSDYGLFTVTLFKKVIEEFKLHAREKKFIVRDFTYNEEELAAGKNEMTKLVTDKKKQFGPLVRWLKVNFSECFCAWIHVKALRVFVESVLRYGLPVNFQAILIRPNKKSTKRLRDVLNQLYAHLDSSATAGGSQSGNQDSVDIPGLGFGQSDYFPYVYYKINVDMVDNKV